MPAISLLSYQIDCFNDRSRFKLLLWGRGCRKTFTVTLEIVDDCFSTEAEGRRTTWVILSRGDRQAMEAIQEAQRHCRAYLLPLQIETSEFVSEDGKRRYTQHEIRFPCGSRIISLPASADTARGYTANVYLDEFSIHQDDVEIWRAMLPVLRGRFRVIVSSTPKGGRNRVFYRLVNDDEGIWSKHIVDIYQAVEAGLEFDIEAERKALNDPEGWAQEFELQWIDEASVWLPYDLIQTCEHEDAGHPEGYLRHATYIGNDIGRHRDLWVAWVLERIGDVLWTREVSILKKASFAEQDAELDRLVRTYRPARIAMDKTGMGEKPVEDAQRRYGASVVEGISFSIQSKYQLATIGKQAFERRLWRVPIDRACRDDFHKLKRTNTLSGAPKFDAEADATGHADRAWAGFLALYAAGTGVAIEGAYAKSPSSRPDYSARRKAAIEGVASGGGISGWV
ncbi:terminase [Leptolyngbya sp. Heron Island J]|uniref:phage terminase large subunit family protein n=1 Tax=Leptolyngbya sp. Heron Island J TaxID=1385935 RepID=UPI0003B9F5EA|nr:terminase family protein [Leptolyngbya sp. Heron Island J]ESA37326.1 terminase [Leptolyngbya sp. Heron Island J]